MNSMKYLLIAGGFLMSSENITINHNQYNLDEQGRPIPPSGTELQLIPKDGGEL